MPFKWQSYILNIFKKKLTVLSLTLTPPNSSNSSTNKGYKYDTCSKTRIILILSVNNTTLMEFGDKTKIWEKMPKYSLFLLISFQYIPKRHVVNCYICLIKKIKFE